MRRRATLSAVAGIGLVAVALYFWAGSPKGLFNKRARAPDAPHQVTPDKLAAAAEQLSERLRRNPDDGRGWRMLARSYTALGRSDAAAQAYARAEKLLPNDAGLLADYADALAQARGRRLDGEPFEIVKRALAADPNHLKSLALAGSAEFERKDYAAAIAYWQRIVLLAGPDSELGRWTQASIGQARELGKLSPGGSEEAPSAPATSATPAAAVAGSVRLAPALASKVAPGDAVFIFARPAKGASTLLAVVRVRAGDLPYEFRLDDLQALAPNARLSVQESVVVTARISKSGNAIGRPGDLQGSTKPVAPGATGVELVIDQVRQ